MTTYLQRICLALNLTADPSQEKTSKNNHLGVDDSILSYNLNILDQKENVLILITVFLKQCSLGRENCENPSALEFQVGIGLGSIFIKSFI